MGSDTVIYWFSGTGNSLYAAKKLSAALGARLAGMKDGSPPEEAGGDGAKIGFVFPSYYGNLPRAVKSFVEKIDIKPGAYIFAVVTMGGMGRGSVGALDKALKAKGLRLDYGVGAAAPSNNVILYDPADTDGAGPKLDKLDARLTKIADDIKAGKRKVRSVPFVMNKLYKNIGKIDEDFTVSGACTGCGICEKICPVKNIALESGRPKWLGHCERCVACISWCPVKAIDYGEKTKSRRRYRNPRVKIDELLKN